MNPHWRKPVVCSLGSAGMMNPADHGVAVQPEIKRVQEVMINKSATLSNAPDMIQEIFRSIVAKQDEFNRIQTDVLNKVVNKVESIQPIKEAQLGGVIIEIDLINQQIAALSKQVNQLSNSMLRVTTMQEKLLNKLSEEKTFIQRVKELFSATAKH